MPLTLNITDHGKNVVMRHMWKDLNLELKVDSSNVSDYALKGIEIVQTIVREVDNDGFIFLKYFTKRDCKPRVRLRLNVKEGYDVDDIIMLLDSMKNEGKLSSYEGPADIPSTDIEPEEYWTLGKIASRIALDYFSELKGRDSLQMSRFIHYLLNSLGYPEFFEIKVLTLDAAALINDIFSE